MKSRKRSCDSRTMFTRGNKRRKEIQWEFLFSAFATLLYNLLLHFIAFSLSWLHIRNDNIRKSISLLDYSHWTHRNSFLSLVPFTVSSIMSTAKRLVLSLAGRNESQHSTGASSTRLVGNSYSPGHELDEIAIVSNAGTDTCGRSYGSLTLNGPRFVPGECWR